MTKSILMNMQLPKVIATKLRIANDFTNEWLHKLIPLHNSMLILFKIFVVLCKGIFYYPKTLNLIYAICNWTQNYPAINWVKIGTKEIVYFYYNKIYNPCQGLLYFMPKEKTINCHA